MAASAAAEFDEWLKTTGLTAKIRKQAARIRELERENESLKEIALGAADKVAEGAHAALDRMMQTINDELQKDSGDLGDVDPAGIEKKVEEAAVDDAADARIRELERENESLQKTADAQQKTIEIKSWTIKDLEQDNAELQKKVTKCLRNERAARGIIERLTKDFAKTFESSDFTPEATKKFFLGAMLEFEVADELFSAEDV